MLFNFKSYTDKESRYKKIPVPFSIFIGSILGLDKKAGTKLINRFLANLPSLRRLRSRVEKSARSKTLRAIDGRILHIRSVHSALNTLLQGAGAIICKQWLVHMMAEVYASGLDVKLVGSIHDEYQFEVAKKDVDVLGDITKKAMKQTEESLEVPTQAHSVWKAFQQMHLTNCGGRVCRF